MKSAFDWNVKFILSKASFFQISYNHEIVAANSVSRGPQQLNEYSVRVLFRFLKGSSPREALISLQKEWDLDEDVFRIVVEKLIHEGFLLEIDSSKNILTNGSSPKVNFGQLMVHHLMLRDSVRVFKYKMAIDKHVKDKSVIEIGCGTGILSIFAAKAGAKGVLAIEETVISKLAKQMFDANNLETKIQIEIGNSKNIDVDNQVDVIIHELIDSDPFDENMVEYIIDAKKRFLKPNGRLIPERIEVRCVGFEIENKNRVVKEAEYFTKLYNCDFTPYIDALKASDEKMIYNLVEYNSKLPKILSEECRVFDVSLNESLSAFDQMEVEFEMNIINSGKLGGVILYFIAHLDDEIELTNSPFSPVTHWNFARRGLSKIVEVEQGQRVPLRAKISRPTGVPITVIDFL